MMRGTCPDEATWDLICEARTSTHFWVQNFWAKKKRSENETTVELTPQEFEVQKWIEKYQVVEPDLTRPELNNPWMSYGELVGWMEKNMHTDNQFKAALEDSHTGMCARMAGWGDIAAFWWPLRNGCMKGNYGARIAAELILMLHCLFTDRHLLGMFEEAYKQRQKYKQILTDPRALKLASMDLYPFNDL